MFSKYSTRREFFKNLGWLFLLFLSSCSNLSRKPRIVLQSSFYPDYFKDTIPEVWQQKKIYFGSNYPEQYKNSILKSEFALINDGWINSLNLEEFKNINEYSIFEKLDLRSTNFLNSFDQNQRNKLLPIGVVPYAIIIKNNKDLINEARKSWDFLLSQKLTKKIIFPKSPRITISISKKINTSNSLAKLKKQAMLFDDRDTLNWLIKSEACVAIVPFSLCSKYLKVDPRLSILFPNQGVPLMWHFFLSRSHSYKETLLAWIKSLERKSSVEKLSSQGWYLPFKNNYAQNIYNANGKDILGPSKKCWDNSWSFPILTNSQKLTLEDSWNNSSTP